MEKQFVNRDKLRGKIAEKHFTFGKVAELLEVSANTFGKKMNTDEFTEKEINKLLVLFGKDVLNI